MRQVSRYYIIALLLSVSVFLEVLTYTYMGQVGGDYYYSSSIIYTLAGIAVCILPLLYTRQETISKASYISRFLPGIFYAFAGVLLIYHLSILIPLYNKWPKYWGGDMLPSIKIAGERFLHGEKVYAPATGLLPSGIIPYLPGLWIPFLPAVAFDFDLRYITLAFLFLALALITFTSFKKHSPIPFIPSLITLTAFYLFTNYFLMKDYGFWAMTQEPVVAAFYIFLGFALLRNNYYLIGFAITCCMLSRYSFVLWLPIYFGYVYFTKPRTDFLKLFFSFSGSICLLFVLPFFIHDPAYFFKIPTTYEPSIGFWLRNRMDEKLFYTVGLCKFFSTKQLGSLFTWELVTGFTAPLLLVLAIKFPFAKTLNEKYLVFGSLKISLIFFYAFIQLPYHYLWFVPTLLSFAVVYKFLGDAPAIEPVPATSLPGHDKERQ